MEALTKEILFHQILGRMDWSVVEKKWTFIIRINVNL